MNQKKQLIINMVAGFVNFGISLCISFFLSPYIVKTIGVEANGFITLANNFTNYASLLTIALNSMVGRFVTISIYEGNTERANKYFTSAFYANIIIAAILGMISIFLVLQLDSLINIPKHLTLDIKFLFLYLFLSCILSVIGSVFGVATFVRNKLYLESIRNTQGSIIRAIIIFVGIGYVSPKVGVVGLAGLVSGIVIMLYNIGYTKKLLPEIKVKKEYFEIKYVWTLIKSGIWNTVNRLGQILMDGLDLLISNLFIDATAMGVLALSKTVPNLIFSLMGSIVGVFTPNYTILYAQNKIDELLLEIKQSMKIMGVITNLPVIGLIVCGFDFFQLWQPTQDARLLHILSLLTVSCLVFSGSINCLYNIFTVVNKLKLNSIVVIIHGCISTGIVFVMLKHTHLGVLAIAGVSSLLGILRNLIFTAPYGAKCLGQKWYIFFPDIFKPVLFAILSSASCIMILNKIVCHSWIALVGKGIMTMIISSVIGYYLILNQKEREIIKKTVNSKFKRD